MGNKARVAKAYANSVIYSHRWIREQLSLIINNLELSKHAEPF